MLNTRHASAAAAAAALLLTLSNLPSPVGATSKADYISNAVNATDVLNQQLYNESSGLWSNLWWQSGNLLTAVADLGLVDDDFKDTSADICKKVSVTAKEFNGGNWLNDFYDDEGWWALALIRCYDLTQSGGYLLDAQAIFEDQLTGNDATCGGHWWSKDKTANTAIGNALYLAIGASLASRGATRDGTSYQQYAEEEFTWWYSSALMASNNTFQDGLELSTCKPKPDSPVFTYNQGVILGAMVELNKATSNQTYLDYASKVAHGAIDHLTDSNGILTEVGYPGPPDVTAAMFKGVFARNLGYLQTAAGDDAYVTFLQNNADTIWKKDRQDDGQLGPDWQGPMFTPNAASQGSALDCLVAAAAATS